MGTHNERRVVKLKWKKQWADEEWKQWIYKGEPGHRVFKTTQTQRTDILEFFVRQALLRQTKGSVKKACDLLSEQFPYAGVTTIRTAIKPWLLAHSEEEQQVNGTEPIILGVPDSSWLELLARISKLEELEGEHEVLVGRFNAHLTAHPQHPTG